MLAVCNFCDVDPFDLPSVIELVEEEAEFFNIVLISAFCAVCFLKIIVCFHLIFKRQVDRNRKTEIFCLLAGLSPPLQILSTSRTGPGQKPTAWKSITVACVSSKDQAISVMTATSLSCTSAGGCIASRGARIPSNQGSSKCKVHIPISMFNHWHLRPTPVVISVLDAEEQRVNCLNFFRN